MSASLLNLADFDIFKAVSINFSSLGLTQNRTKIAVIHELLLHRNEIFSHILRKSYSCQLFTIDLI